MNYRCANTPGGTYFFTVNLADGDTDTLVRHMEVLRAGTAAVKRATPIRCWPWSSFLSICT